MAAKAKGLRRRINAESRGILRAEALRMTEKKTAVILSEAPPKAGSQNDTGKIVILNEVPPKAGSQNDTGKIVILNVVPPKAGREESHLQQNPHGVILSETKNPIHSSDC